MVVAKVCIHLLVSLLLDLAGSYPTDDNDVKSRPVNDICDPSDSKSLVW